MYRLADVEPLEKSLKDVIEHGVVSDGNHPVSAELMFSWLMSQPAVDAVPVVRCKDCKHMDNGHCDIHSEEPDQITTGYWFECDDDFFCAYGERRER